MALAVDSTRNSLWNIPLKKVRDPDPHRVLGSGQLHPALEKRIERLLKNAHQRGMPVMIHKGFRSAAEQARLFESGRNVTRAKAGYSFHNYGLAVDIVFYDKNGQPSWDEGHDWEGLGRLGKELGLEWGGDWKRRDRPHFQYPPRISMSTVRMLYKEGGLKGLWDAVDRSIYERSPKGRVYGDVHFSVSPPPVRRLG